MSEIPTRLIDQHGRVVQDLRLSITPRCNFHCTYCDPLGTGTHEPIGTLTVAQVGVILEAATRLGMRSVRFTGGEPLLRKELPAMIALAKRTYGVEDVAITTNASALAKRLPLLLEAGLDRLNISLDALDAGVFERITQGGRFKQVWDGIEAAEAGGLVPVKLNAVVMRDVNDGEIEGLAGLTRERSFHVRFIEYMHLNNSDPDAYRARFVPGREIRDRVEAAYGKLEPVDTDPSAPARLFTVPGWPGRIGFINPVSEPFCGACSRMRVTSDGMLRPCLLNDREFDLQAALHSADPVGGVIEQFMVAANRKVASGLTAPSSRPRTMVAIGG